MDFDNNLRWVPLFRGLYSTHAGKKQYRNIKDTTGNEQPDVRANKTRCVVLKLSLAFTVLIQFL